MTLSMDDLKPAEYNPREIGPEAAEALGKSVERFGDISGIVWNKRTGNLVAGHQRVDQLRKAGGQVVDGAVVIGTGKRERRFPVRVVDWALAEEKAANVAANNPHISGSFTDGLGSVLADVHAYLGDEDFAGLGLDGLELDAMKGTDQGVIDDVEDDDVPEPPAEPLSRVGDVWQLGDHRVTCGSCLDAMPKEGRVCLTDPPYAVNIEQAAVLRDLQRQEKAMPPAAYDAYVPEGGSDKDAASYLGFLSLVPSDVVVMTYPIDQHFKSLAAAIDAGRFEFKRELVWAKDRFTFWMQSTYQQQHEPVIVLVRKGKPLHANKDTDSKSTLLSFPRPAKHDLHPTQKPLKLWVTLMAWHTASGDRVIDPFLGSGTSIIAAEELGRVCHGVELSPAFVDVIVQRWEQHTGGKAKRITKGK